MTTPTDEDKLELVRRCTYMIRVYGKPVHRPTSLQYEEGQRRYEIENLLINSMRGVQLVSDPFDPPDDPAVVKGRIELLYNSFRIFSVPHRANVRSSILVERMWSHDQLVPRALEILRKHMILDDMVVI